MPQNNGLIFKRLNMNHDYQKTVRVRKAKIQQVGGTARSVV